jgi:uncharacterized cofD-like protein
VSWGSEPRVVALGGGHGLAASLSALRRLTGDLTAVVTVADNGGSSGRLREEFGTLPPGDLRMALAALCGDDRWGQTWAKVLQHRFSSAGEMDGHAVGNLLIVALWELLGDHVAGLDWVGSLLGARGRVLPMALSPLDIAADVRGADPEDPEAISTVRGQIQVATTPGAVLDVRLEPADPVVSPDAVRAIADADWVVLGPGSWYSSVLPHVLVPALREALTRTPARVIVNLNLVAQPGETDGYTAEDHLTVLHRHAPDLRIDTVLADHRSVGAEARLRIRAESLGARLVLADVAQDGAPGQHDPEKLARAYELVMKAPPSRSNSPL